MVETHEPTKTKQVPEDSTEDLIEKLKEQDITRDQAHELKDIFLNTITND